MITAKVIADSISEANKRITTFELDYPRWIHSELMTHRSLSRNAASSRAIPVSATIKQILDDPATPIHWGKNQAGMSAKEELEGAALYNVQRIWLEARDAAIHHVKLLIDQGLHKQVANRILEPWVHIKVVVTATEWDNFFHLRNHPDAQPEIHELARVMWEAKQKSTPRPVEINDYHLPYITDEDRLAYSLEDCIKLSASLCAQVSYRKADESIEKALAIYDKLVGSVPCHSSPFEHQATPSLFANKQSGNFKGWYQYRQRIPHNVCHTYQPHPE